MSEFGVISEDQESLEPIDYTGYLKDMKRCTHEIRSLELVPDEKPDQVSPDIFERSVLHQIQERMKYMMGLHCEIQELRELIK